jgi:hypothetical protein
MSSKSRKSPATKKKGASLKKGRSSKKVATRRKKKVASSSLATASSPTWNGNRIWVMDDKDGGNAVAPGVFSAGAQFQLLYDPNSGKYNVVDMGGMPAAWTGMALTEKTGTWPSARRRKTPKFSPATKTRFDGDGASFYASFSGATQRLVGLITASNGHNCSIEVYQVQAQIDDGSTFLIIWVADLDGNQNPDGGVYGHS